MQFRRNLMSPVYALLLAGVAASLVGTARADVRHEDIGANAQMLKARASVHRLHTTNTTPGDPDTTWIGHVFGSTGLPGDAGGYGPFHIGRGGYRPHWAGTPGPATTPANGGVITYTNVQADNGYWDFDRLNAGEADTLQGWWPLVTPFQSTGSSNLSDRQRPFSGFDYGNEGNYRGNDTKKNTFGVISYWHRDNGGPASSTISGTNPVSPNWTPLNGSFSLWCGLRGHGDLTAKDPITNQYVNCNVIAMDGDNHFIQTGAASATGSDANFPGYGSQWDQMVYKDFSRTSGTAITLSFKYTTNMSAGYATTPPTRVGWFDKDPLLTVTQNDGNFISSTDAVNQGPIDSFMVYVGVPVNDAACAYTNTLVPSVTFKPVWDPLRRWFSEVVRIDQPYYEVLTTWGATSGTQTPSITIPAGLADALGNNIRVVFRVKTNRGWDDEDSFVSSFSSGGKGAAIIDDISVNGGAATGFESASDVDNTAATNAAWHTTGKPPGVFFHWHNLQAGSPGGYVNGLPYTDPCGALGGISRQCNLIGNIITAGNHDVAGERDGGAPHANDEDRQNYFMSPTLNLLASGNGAGNYNSMGIDQDIAFASSDYWLAFDGYLNLIYLAQTGHGLRAGWQTYPGTQTNGSICWSTPVKSIFFSDFGGTTGCFSGQNGNTPLGVFAIGDGTMINYSGRAVPDSMRAYIEELTTCFRRPLTIDCNPATGIYANAYFDNFSVGFIDGGQPPGLSESISDNLQDAFPNNSDNTFVGSPAFDTLAALARTGENRALNTGDLNRNSVPGDSMVVVAPGPNVRVDLVFRILPGPGNYFGTVPTGQQKIGFLKKRPDGGTGAGNQATPNDGSFWGSYLGDIGPFGSGGIWATAAKPMGDFSGNANKWDPSIWCSARCDTAENNLFPCTAVAGNASAIATGVYISAYHESEMQANWTSAQRNGTVSPFTAAPNRGAFITPHYRCILINTTLGSAVDQTNINCNNVALGDNSAAYFAKWTAGGSGPGAGYLANLTSGLYTDPTTVPAGVNTGSNLGLTKEFSKIIPDGQLTAGAHVEYFYRKTFDGNFVAPGELLPDTTLCYPNLGAGGDFDGNRWQHMSVLPDRWKDTSYGGTGMACMLVLNMAMRRGEMVIWDNVAQTLGLMSPAKRGASTGFFMGATEDLPGDITMLSAGEQVSLNLGQKGTLYDVYNVQGGESNTPAGRLGSRYAGAGSGLTVGKTSTEGPTKLMLKNYYRHVFILASDGSTGSNGGFSPVTDQTDDDIGVLTDYMTDGSVGSATPRAVVLIGRDIARGLNTNFPSFGPTFFGANFRNDDFRGLSGVADDVPDLIPASPIAAPNALAGSAARAGAIYGVFSPCTFFNDVLNVNSAVTGATAAATYENLGSSGPYVSMVYAPAGGSRIANTLEGAWTFGTFGGQGSRYTLSRGGQHYFWLDALAGAVGTVCLTLNASPTGVGDGFNSGSKFVNFMNLRSENPMRSGEARIAFGITKTEKVEVKVYDVTGRLVKTVANQVFAGGQEHVVRWDGTDNQGQLVARGVYFYQLRSPSFVSEKKLTVLKD